MADNLSFSIVGERLQIREGCTGSGRTYVRLGPDIELDGKKWIPVLQDDEEAPEFRELDSLETAKPSYPLLRACEYFQSCRRDCAQKTPRATEEWRTDCPDSDRKLRLLLVKQVMCARARDCTAVVCKWHKPNWVFVAVQYFYYPDDVYPDGCLSTKQVDLVSPDSIGWINQELEHKKRRNGIKCASKARRR